MQTTNEIRALHAEDRAAWDALWAGYLRFYRHELAPHVTDETFRRLCEREDGMFGLVAVREDEELVGLAHAVVHRSTWATVGDCYLEDLFVAPAGRGGGLGRALIEATAAAADERGCERLYWQTQQFNGPARSLYDQVASLTSFVVYERALA